MLSARMTAWWCAFGLSAAAPAAVTIISLSTVFFLFLGDTEFDGFGSSGGSEHALRLVGIAVVILLNIAVATALLLPMVCRASRLHTIRHAERILTGLTLGALAALGTGFSILDLTFSVGESASAVVAALALGFAAVGPLLLRSAVSVRKLLVTIAIYGLFAGWIMVQRDMNWNMRRHFRRAYSQIHPGMTRAEIDAVMRREFREKGPVARYDNWGAQFTLDPDDGRFDSEFIIIEMSAGRVVSTHYSPD